MTLQPPVVILADGPAPSHPEPLRVLANAGSLICCDGAANNLPTGAPAPVAIVGDLDSLDEFARQRFADRLVHLPAQDTGDLEKAILWAGAQGAEAVAIIGATGGRDDHTLANTLLLWSNLDVVTELVTESGIFSTVTDRAKYRGYPGQQIGLFPSSLGVTIRTSGLKYDLKGDKLSAMHRGSSNLCAGESFEIVAEGGPVLVFRAHRPVD
jgi:thiamine pyrophosphokinase